MVPFGLAEDTLATESHVYAVWCTDMAHLPCPVTIRPTATRKQWSNTTCFDALSYTGDVLDGMCAINGALHLYADNAPTYLTLRPPGALLWIVYVFECMIVAATSARQNDIIVRAH